jgi:hypothetical protein
MHLWFALALPVLCRTRRGIERSVYVGALPEQQALDALQIIDSCQDLICKVVVFQSLENYQIVLL